MNAARGPRFSARPSRGHRPTSRSAGPGLDRLLTHLISLGRGPEGRQRLAESADAVLVALHKAADAGAWSQVLELARLAEPAFALSGRWGAWESALELALGASRALGDRTAEGLALHQLGIRALALGEEEAARALLSEALAVRSQTGQDEAAAKTASQLQQLSSVSPS